jgi:DNA repair exonuclease SbcCD ATPase subunit
MTTSSAKEVVESNLRIIELTAENVKRLQAITIKPDGNAIVIGGKNGQGKSSTLDAIAYALGGAKLLPEEPIRRGQKAAKVRVDLGELVVERRFTSSGSTLAVLSKDGAKYPSPQSILDKLVGDLSFDPLAFVSMKPAERLEALKKVVGIDFTNFDAARAEVFEERKIVNREVKQLEGELASLPYHEDAPAESVDVGEVLTELQQVRDHNSKIELFEQNKRAFKDQIDRVDQQIERCNDEISELQQRFEQLNKEKQQLKTRREELQSSLTQGETDSASLTRRDEQAVLLKISQLEITNRKVRENQRRDELKEIIKSSQQEADELTARVEEIDKAKEQVLAESTFPVPGLSFSDSGVLLNGLPFEQASESDQLEVSAAMGLAQHPKLRVLLIKKAALLDEEHMTRLVEWANKNECQCWIERVGKGKECSVVIEDGMVAV